MAEDRIVRTVCSTHCANVCAVLAHVKNGRLVKLEPADYPDNRYKRICLRAYSEIQRMYHPDRLKHPLKRVGARGEGKWQRITWEEAIDTVASKMKEIRDKYGSRAFAMWGGSPQGWIHNFGARRFNSLFQGTSPEGCSAASDHAICMSFGLCFFSKPIPETARGLPCVRETHDMVDLLNSRLIIIWGRNVAETYIPDMHFIMDTRDKGAKVIVIDPRLSSTAARADWWVPITPGTDAALALGMMNVIFSRHLEDREFISKHTIGPILVRSDNGQLLREHDITAGGSESTFLVWDTIKGRPVPADASGVNPALDGVYKPSGIECKPAFQLLRELVEHYNPEAASRITGVPAGDIVKLALEYAQTRPAAMLVSQGMGRYFGGHESGRAVVTLAAMCGNIGIHGGGVSFLQSVIPITHERMLNIKDWFYPTGTGPTVLPGMLLLDAIAEGKPYPIKALWMSGKNVLFNHPNRNRILNETIPRLEFIVALEQFINPSSKYADILLPVSHMFERTDLKTWYNNFYFELAQKVVDPPGECKDELEILRLLAEKLGFGEYFSKTPEEYIKLLLKSDDPVMAGVTLERLQQELVIRADMPEPYVAFADRKFPTLTGRLEFYSENLKQFHEELPVFVKPLHMRQTDKKYPLVFFTPHSKFSSHSSHWNAPWILEIAKEPSLAMNPADAAARGINDADIVNVYNDLGKLKVRAKVTSTICPGVVAVNHGWYPQNFIAGHPNDLAHEEKNPVQTFISAPNWNAYDILVEVEKG